MRLIHNAVDGPWPGVQTPLSFSGREHRETPRSCIPPAGGVPYPSSGPIPSAPLRAWSSWRGGSFRIEPPLVVFGAAIQDPNRAFDRFYPSPAVHFCDDATRSKLHTSNGSMPSTVVLHAHSEGNIVILIDSSRFLPPRRQRHKPALSILARPPHPKQAKRKCRLLGKPPSKSSLEPPRRGQHSWLVGPRCLSCLKKSLIDNGNARPRYALPGDPAMLY